MNPALSEGLYGNSVHMFPIALKSLGLHGPKAHFASADQLECYLFRETVPDHAVQKHSFLLLSISALCPFRALATFHVNLFNIFGISFYSLWGQGLRLFYHCSVPCACQPIHSLALGRHPINIYWTSTFVCTESSPQFKQTNTSKKLRTKNIADRDSRVSRSKCPGMGQGIYFFSFSKKFCMWIWCTAKDERSSEGRTL